MNRYFCAGVILAMALSAAGAAAQDRPVPARGGMRGQGPGGDPSQPFPGRGGRIGGPPRDDAPAARGTAKISGRVVSAETGAPIRRAQVRVTSPEVRTNRLASTDSNGAYEIADLPAARYRLQISKAGYVTLDYGQARPFEAGKTLELADAQSLEKVDFSLPRGSVIAGRIADEFGDPIADAQVQAMRYQFGNGQRQLVPVGRTSTSDDIGQFRIFGLMPGEYFLRATVRSTPAMMTAVEESEGERSGYPLTYYPGTTDAGQAQPITVGLGQELGSVVFSLIPSRLSRVVGMVLGSTGRPFGGALVVLRPAAGGGMGGALNIGGGNQVRADGTFELSNVPPGEYRLEVQPRPQQIRNASMDVEFASVPVTVAGSDISGLTIVTAAGGSVSGRVVAQGQSAQKPNIRGVQILAMADAGTQTLMGMAGRAFGNGRVNDDGTFELRGLFGAQVFRITGIPTGWTLKSIVLDGQDITDAPFEFRSGSRLSGLVVTLIDRVTEVSGTVKDTRGQNVTDYVLVIFPQEPALRTSQSRFVRALRPSQTGAFSVTGLPPGRYLAAAVESLENGAQDDPALLEQLQPRATSFSLEEGRNLTLDVVMR
jgi:hypothetical protein